MDQKKLLNWYDQQSSRVVDLVGDFVGRELFIIDGDSLLLECFANQKLDFHPGFQLLHATYLVEKYLQKLQQRKCVFEIVFFAQNAHLCVPSGVDEDVQNRYLLAREVIIQHLDSISLQSGNSLTVRKFENFRSPQFEEHLTVSGAYLFMCHDGAFGDSDKKGSKNEEASEDGQDLEDEKESEVKDNWCSDSEINSDDDDNDDDDDDDDDDDEDDETFDDAGSDQSEADAPASKPTSRVLLRQMIYWFVSHGCNISLINSLEFRDTKVMSMVVEGTSILTDQSSLSETFGLGALTLDSQSAGISETDTITALGALDLEAVKTIIEKVIHEQPSLTQRQCLLIVTLATILGNVTATSAKDTPGAQAMILHLILLQDTRLEDRAVRAANSSDPKFFDLFLQVAKVVLRSKDWEKTMKTHNIQCDLLDLVDGRMFFEIYTLIEKVGINSAISPDTLSPFNNIVSLVNQLGGTKLELATLGTKKPMKEIKKQTAPQGDMRVLPFKNKVFDHHLEPVHIEVDDSMDTEGDLKASKLFTDGTHWHSSKPLDPKKAEPKEVARAHKRNQFYMTEMKKYAESLLGSAGMSEVDVIIAGPSTPAKGTPVSKGNPSSKGNPAKGKSTPSQVRSNPVRELAAAAIQQKAVEAERKQRAKWVSKLETMAKGPQDPMSRFYIADEYLSSLSKDSRIVLEAQVLVYMLDASVQAITGHENTKGGKHITTTHIWGVLTRLMKLKRGISADMVEYVDHVCQRLELPAVRLQAQTSQTLCFKPSVIRQQPNGAIGMSGIDFQLMHGGPFMERSIGSLPDPRTPTFDPDRWQRDVLDQIDAKKSAFIVAPTSSGKTFISFYAMRQILKEDNEGILVYVAPTKALVNQIAAEVQARFAKSYPAKTTGKSIWAIHTRDHRINNPMGCQILITVPHILQIMLLSPSNAKAWTPRLRRIIFDEIHCIGQAEDGVIWEQLLLLAPCPIIALSATVGNPEEFYKWLNHAQGTNGHDLKMIQHKYRYSDLRNYRYCPPQSFVFKGFPNVGGLDQLGLDEADDMEFMHPVLSLLDRSRGIPNDFSLEPRDCLTLWKAMNNAQTKDFPVDPRLNPSSVFSDAIIGKKDVIEWQKPLIELVNTWMKNRNSPFEAVLSELHRQSAGSKAKADGEDTPSSSTQLSVSQENPLLSTTLPLICSLQAQRALPALFFNYDRHKCEEICEHLLNQLKEAEEKWKAESPAWKAKVEKWTEWKKASEDAKKKTAKPPKKSKSADKDDPTSRADEMRDSASSEGSMLEFFDPERPVEKFSLANPKKLLRSEFMEYADELQWREIPQWLIDALERGIGVHHAGMNRKYRQICEILFRKGFLQVVIATGTLALGINMPCKTVVFSGDSIFLTSLNFRQASGRAGRRGFDLLGNVVFQHVPEAKIHRLVSSKLPDLNGHFPVTASLILRLFILLDGSKQAPSAVKSINSLLSSPRICLGGAEMKSTVLHYLRFSIEYLRRNHLLSITGSPLNFAGCVSHLYYTENSSFAFHALLSSGYFHRACKDIHSKPQKTIRKLMLVMCYIFKRYPLRQSTLESYRAPNKKTSSIVILPDLPKEAAKVLRAHNHQVLDTYTGYVSTFIDQHVTTRDRHLPFSNFKCGGDKSAAELGVMDTESINSAPKITSPFYALSGQGDSWGTVADLCETVGNGVWLEESAIPYVPGPSKTHPLNAYLYDFFRHGNVHELEKGNGVRRSDVWFELNDFSMILATLTTSLNNILNPSGADMDMLNVAGGGDIHEVQTEDNIAEDEGQSAQKEAAKRHAERLHPKPAAPLASVKKSRASSADTFDNWEDEMDDHEEKAAVQAEKQAAAKNKPKAVHKAGLKDDKKSLLLVLHAFNCLRTEFDTKFKKMWA
ncbi:hypothetical protein N7466_006753 [Penicillium verhagenii]|uniref:uncharacterized protein n=1 Tax=Penicillium verhagenii TaxID=1562060 RepID=UPI0025451940|nr:uncharacterized protein N7466_006753 [Penicillium verhagenii]KAJ5927797.1 hypothetical protein N7466_006753 [Penicillium verhagenii]